MSRTFLAVTVTVLAAGCSGRAGQNRATTATRRAEVYTECSQAAPCAADHECVFGLCVPRCGTGPACVERAVCQDDGTCGTACDDAHPCTQAFSCVEGVCKDDPCGHPEFWPLSLASRTLPVVIHYRDPTEAETVDEAMRLVEHSWRVETEDLGFDPPLPDQGRCGPDERFDIFIWRSYRAGTGDVIAPNPDTPWDDYFAYLILDPWGPYGGDILDGTVAHELNHAMQAVHDWNEAPFFFEATAQLVEDLVFDDDNNYMTLLADFQQHPDWAFDHDDEYETWYFYGTVLYLMYLRDGVFDGDTRFVADLWRACRNPAGDNEPDVVDALDALLRTRASTTYLDSLVAFSRWRFFTGRRDDGLHFEEGAGFPVQAEVRIDRVLTVGDPPARSEPAPEMLGVSYITVRRAVGGEPRAVVRFQGAPGVRWSVQAVPGAEGTSDGDALDVSSGEAVLDFGDRMERTLVILALPPSEELADPDRRTPERFPFTIEVAPRAPAPEE
jgi:hypothetical protein